MRKYLSIFILVAFIVHSFLPHSCAQVLDLPLPGVMVSVSPDYHPPMLKGIRVDASRPLKFDFILDTGNSALKGQPLKDEAAKLVRYFLAALTIPEKDLWVNLSPYEKDRIIPDEFSLTEMGRDLLAQDYVLKQITASLIYPRNGLGGAFWKRVYQKAYERYGTTDIPIDTFNKVWVMPEKAVVYENGAKVFVVASRLKVVLESDYLAASRQKAVVSSDFSGSGPQELAKEIIRDIIVPELEKEVNEGKNFAPLRQVYSSLILAKWYKEALRESILTKKYAGQGKVNGVDRAGPSDKDRIYSIYLQAFKKGVFDFVQEEYDDQVQATVPRKYFSGGFDFAQKIVIEKTGDAATVPSPVGDFVEITGELQPAGVAVDGGRDVPEDVMATIVDRDVENIVETEPEQRPVDRRHESTRMLAEKIYAQEVRAENLKRIYTAQQVSGDDIETLINQLNHDPLSRILELDPGAKGFEDGASILILRRPGTSEAETGIKDLNTSWGEETNNRFMGRTNEISKRNLLEGKGIRSLKDILASTYKDMTVVASTGAVVPEKRMFFKKGIEGELAETLNDITRSVGKGPVMKTGDGLIDIGVSTLDVVEGEGALEVARGKVLSVMKANMAITLGRVGQRSGLFKAADDPFTFKPENFMAAVKRAAALKKELRATGVDVFVEIDGNFYLQRGVKKLMRKQIPWSEFVSRAAYDADYVLLKEQIKTEEVYNKVQEFYNWLGLGDYIKQWQLDFNEAYQRGARIARLKADLRAIKVMDGGSPKDVDPLLRQKIADARELIRQDPRLPSRQGDPVFSNVVSEMEAYALAAGMPKLGLINVDIIDMGGSNALEFERLNDALDALFADVGYKYESLGKDGLEKMNALLMMAADRVTEDFQSKIRRLQEYLDGKVGVVFIKMGGDEIVVGVDDFEKLTPELVSMVQDITQGRVAASQSIGDFRDRFAQRRSFLLNGKEVSPTPEIISRMALAALFLGQEDDIAAIKEAGDRAFVIRDAQGVSKRYPLGFHKGGAGSSGVFEAVVDNAGMTDAVGGIDLNPASFTLERLGARADLQLPANNGGWNGIEINGLTPVIFAVRPLGDLSEIL